MEIKNFQIYYIGYRKRRNENGMIDYKKEYHKNHSKCPYCGSKEYSSTYVAFIHGPGLFTKDTNRVSCANCNWYGITHDLVGEED